MSKKWGGKKFVKLLKEYEKHPCLWNTGSAAYRDGKITKYKAYMELIKAANLENIKEAKMRIRSIRNAYLCELAKIVNSQKAGEVIYKPRVPWFPIADRFLRHVLKSKYIKNDVPINETSNPLTESLVEIKLEIDEKDTIASEHNNMLLTNDTNSDNEDMKAESTQASVNSNDLENIFVKDGFTVPMSDCETQNENSNDTQTNDTSEPANQECLDNFPRQKEQVNVSKACNYSKLSATLFNICSQDAYDKKADHLYARNFKKYTGTLKKSTQESNLMTAIDKHNNNNFVNTKANNQSDVSTTIRTDKAEVNERNKYEANNGIDTSNLRNSTKPSRYALDPDPEPLYAIHSAQRDLSTTFGDYIASKHRSYSHHVRSVVEHLIADTLFKADMGHFEPA